MSSSYAFDVDTRCDKVGPEEFSARVTDRWNALTGNANGGYLSALALTALGQRVAHPDVLTAATFFLRPASPGPVRITTEVIREGRRTATAQARVLGEGAKEVVRTTATFGDLAPAQGRVVQRGTAPDLPDPVQCLDPFAALELDLSIARRVDYRVAELPGFVRGEVAGEASLEFWMRFADGRDTDPVALAFLVDAAAPAVLQLGEWSSTTVELTVHVRARPAPGWLACRASTRHLRAGLHEEDFEIWDSAGVLVAQSRQLAMFH
jgi:acyl-coenzyme A thioesterase PaaI-like protein